MRDWLTPTRLDTITQALRERLSPYRLAHTWGVAHWALHLSKRWGADDSEVLTAVLFHDIAKEESLDRQRARIIEDLGAFPAEYEDQTSVWHALASAAVARREFGVPVPEVLRAISLHPTGTVGMSLLEKIVFLADYTDLTRHWAGVGELRDLARRDLQAAVDDAIFSKTAHVLQKGRPLQYQSFLALQEAQKRREEVLASRSHCVNTSQAPALAVSAGGQGKEIH
ncbi:MAG TPA: bis(5'-nucleosyl)-tetraphosphatase (symmetrical) YqeK [Candidatus Sumerlaeota bacterium]|mgnify:CR=1 FL=1|nr:bis(5'-nucleosyl)-tetraphosphatase (symmetrical) YqeK [Candidatus Sumerlaeota bacterium]HPS01143.1 bis(5'-nucleosyl)-tetraphosphatase (symmetrical) YqeK [Candidatus Sumerlaeota bacterium]